MNCIDKSVIEGETRPIGPIQGLDILIIMQMRTDRRSTIRERWRNGDFYERYGYKRTNVKIY